MFTQAELVIEMPKLRKFASKLTRNNSEADDLLQSTLLRALEKVNYFETGTDLFKWSSKIMYNIFVTDYRRKVKFETQYDPESHRAFRSSRRTLTSAPFADLAALLPLISFIISFAMAYISFLLHEMGSYRQHGKAALVPSYKTREYSL